MSFFTSLSQATAALKQASGLIIGNPMVKTQLKNLTGSQIAETDERAHVWERPELTHPAVGLTPAKLHQLLTGAESGSMNDMLALFEDMEERDGHIFAELDKRKRTLLSLDWYVAPPEDASAAEKTQAAVIQKLMRAIGDFDIVIKDALDAIGKGFSGQEISWVRDDSTWYIESLEFQVPQRFAIASDNRTLMLANGINDPEPLWNNKWLMHTHKAKSGYLVRGGLHRILAWPYVFKNYSVRDLAEFLEIYGLPLRLGTYPSGATQSEKYTLLRAVMDIGHRAAGIIPQGMQIDFKEAAKGTSDPFESMIKWCEMTQSKAILGGTLTTQADGKSSTNALGNIHEVARLEIRDSDARQLATSFSRDLVAPLMRINFPNVHPRRYPKFVFDLSEPEDITTFAEAIPKLAGVQGMRIGAEWLHGKLGIPVAGIDEAIVSTTIVNTKPEALSYQAALTAQMAHNALGSMASQSQAAEQQLDDAADDEAIKDHIELMSQRLGQSVVDKLDAATGYDEALAILSSAEPSAAVDALAESLEQYMTAAGLWGALHQQPLEPLDKVNKG
ncbi:DUF935 domain-containing protein [Psychrobacter pygoscelis]|uniref:DUF935 domain-containing protein n=1 Tax=Psychrobacter pygoscelis TaxID=2488563 RepID=UPI00103A959B|nr:DUF935 domain-containing protein [Psychrobacter pygoscelis]